MLSTRLFGGLIGGVIIVVLISVTRGVWRNVMIMTGFWQVLYLTYLLYRERRDWKRNAYKAVEEAYEDFPEDQKPTYNKELYGHDK